jgi:hypothetical protein
MRYQDFPSRLQSIVSDNNEKQKELNTAQMALKASTLELE